MDNASQSITGRDGWMLTYNMNASNSITYSHVVKIIHAIDCNVADDINFDVSYQRWSMPVCQTLSCHTIYGKVLLLIHLLSYTSYKLVAKIVRRLTRSE